MSELQSQLHSCITQALAPSRLVLRDDSAAHAGHAGAREGAHFFAHVVSDRFRGLQLLQRHRLVYAAAAPLLSGRIHALQIHAQTPEEAAPAQPEMITKERPG